MVRSSMFIIGVFLGATTAYSQNSPILIQRGTGTDTLELRRTLESLGGRRVQDIPTLKGELWTIPADSAADKEVIRRRAQGTITTSEGDPRTFVRKVPEGNQPRYLQEHMKSDYYRERIQNREVVQFSMQAFSNDIWDKGFDKADGVETAGSLTFTLFNYELTAVNRKRFESAAGEGAQVYSADLLLHGQEWGQAIFTVDKTGVVGRVTGPDHIYTVTLISEGFHAVAEILPALMLTEHHAAPGAAAAPATESCDIPAELQLCNANATPNPVKRVPGKTTLTIGIAFAHQPACALKQSWRLFLSHLIDETNLSFANSNIPAQLALSGICVVSEKKVDEWLANDATLVLMQTDPLAKSLREWRVKTESNIVALVIPSETFEGAATINSDAERAFVVISKEGAVENLTLAHEVGHLFGGCHEANDDRKCKAHGYHSGKRWRTIMANNCGCVNESAVTCPCIRQAYWSDPAIKHPIFHESTDAQGQCREAQLIRDRVEEIAKFKGN